MNKKLFFLSAMVMSSAIIYGQELDPNSTSPTGAPQKAAAKTNSTAAKKTANPKKAEEPVIPAEYKQYFAKYQKEIQNEEKKFNEAKTKSAKKQSIRILGKIQKELKQQLEKRRQPLTEKLTQTKRQFELTKDKNKKDELQQDIQKLENDLKTLEAVANMKKYGKEYKIEQDKESNVNATANKSKKNKKTKKSKKKK